MVPTQALLAALTALAAPAPASPQPDLPPLTAQGESMRFAHPVMTNTQNPTAQAPTHHTDQPKRRGGGGGGGGIGGNSSNQSASATDSTPSTSAGSTDTQGRPATTGETAATTPTDPSSPSVLAPQTETAVDPAVVAAAFMLTATTPATAAGGSNGVAAVMPDAVSEVGDAPVQTPEPGTLILLALAGAGVGGGTVVRKWVRRKKK